MSHEQRRSPLLNVGTMLLGILLAVASIGAMISVGHANRVGSTASGVRGSLGAPLRISTLEQGAVNCPYGAAFSPDGNHLVVLGSRSTCAPSTSRLTSNIVAIYDAHSGVMTLYVQLDKLLGIDTGLPLDQQTIRMVKYFSLGWSPDGKHIAIIFTAFTSADILTPETEWDAGLIVLDTEHGSALVLHGDSGYFPSLSTVGGGFPIWNVVTGTEASSAYTPEAGLAYAWHMRGTPYPIVKASGVLRQLPIAAGPRYPIGNPAGNSTFTIWQPGVVIGSDKGASTAIFATVFPSWSPDGKYVTLMSAGAHLPLAKAPTHDAPAPGVGGSIAYPTPSVMPAVPARDTALVAVQRRAGTRGWALVAWNPAGTLLASINCHAPGDEALEIRANNSTIIQGSATLPLANGDTGCRNMSSGASAYPPQPMMLLWAPSGDRVMVCDQKAGTITIWPVSQPAA